MKKHRFNCTRYVTRNCHVTFLCLYKRFRLWCAFTLGAYFCSDQPASRRSLRPMLPGRTVLGPGERTCMTCVPSLTLQKCDFGPGSPGLGSGTSSGSPHLALQILEKCLNGETGEDEQLAREWREPEPRALIGRQALGHAPCTAEGPLPGGCRPCHVGPRRPCHHRHFLPVCSVELLLSLSNVEAASHRQALALGRPLSREHCHCVPFSV